MSLFWVSPWSSITKEEKQALGKPVVSNTTLLCKTWCINIKTLNLAKSASSKCKVAGGERGNLKQEDPAKKGREGEAT